jgi:predicted nucleotidyltransferase
MATAITNKTVRRVRVTKRLLHNMVQRIVARFQPEKIILFGSYAYGRPHADSDVDLLVIMESDEEPRRLGAQQCLTGARPAVAERMPAAQ